MMNTVTLPRELTDEICEAIALEARCCGGIAYDIYEAIIAAAPANDGWINIEDEIPANEGYYLTYSIAGCDVDYFDGNSFPRSSYATHWMPLPEGPKK